MKHNLIRPYGLMTGLAVTVFAVLTTAGCGGGGIDGGGVANEDSSTRLVDFQASNELVDTDQTRAISGSRKGVQALLLPRWSRKSCDNFVAAATASGTPAEIEVAILWCNDSSPFGNLLYVVDKLIRAGKRVTIALHLGLHSDQSDATLQNRTDRFQKEIVGPYSGKTPALTFKLLPSLEDSWNQETFLKKAALIAIKLNWPSSVNLRRSGLTDLSSLPQSLKVTRTVSGKTQTETFVLQREAHTYIESAAQHHAYSNDGVFVWLDQPRTGSRREREASADNAVPSSQTKKYRLTDWTSAIQNLSTRPGVNTTAYLLWRPMYNLFSRSESGGYARYVKPATAYTQRNDSESSPAFDATEMDALKQYLGAR
jgi:hypothetical protein